jgi:hypothetical protein
MNLNGLLSQFQGNAATLMMGAALHYATAGHVDTKHLDAESLAIGLTALLAQIDSEHPGLAAKYGWCRLSDVQAMGSAINAAEQATPPVGLQ